MSDSTTPNPISSPNSLAWLQWGIQMVAIVVAVVITLRTGKTPDPVVIPPIPLAVVLSPGDITGADHDPNRPGQPVIVTAKGTRVALTQEQFDAISRQTK